MGLYAFGIRSIFRMTVQCISSISRWNIVFSASRKTFRNCNIKAVFVFQVLAPTEAQWPPLIIDLTYTIFSIRFLSLSLPVSPRQAKPLSVLHGQILSHNKYYIYWFI